MRWLDNYLYSGNRSHSAAPQKKYQLYGRRLTDPVTGTLFYILHFGYNSWYICRDFKIIISVV